MNLVMWGPASSGKTMFLSQLFVQIRPGSQWAVRPASADVMGVVESHTTQLRIRSAFPPPTPIAGQTLNFRLVHEPSGREAEIAIKDRAGVESETLDRASFELIREADGLLLMFDHTREPMQLLNEMQLTLMKLDTDRRQAAAIQIGHRDPRPIAVCLTKADLLLQGPGDLERARGAPDAFVRDHLEPKVVACVEEYCAHPRFFPVSSIGVRMRFGVIDPVQFLDESLRLRVAQDGEPLNLLEPFAWLFDEVTRARGAEGRS
jgi:hypothetical protein